ncbi:MAG TPA: shikimate dehydrogenase [Cyanobacteria bacterium UBA11149]|nr:shikimate dehydrogenase [Cyanobacteria bacterium UBA11367]HBE57531.1 shikimate dehydrogenase [Cyanobacteria bacterium UBA11366]HBK62561.1 shikimate dehydrogenase [Cyanobacteria bacterium UBA11166]HBR74979.1 shikimate dehydrogenase [Cyanobacteria bacterium UBA11159]HBS69583.1 shikimate dehydrogenase [Cyanobacteria bacterium UBA11153]HBW88470.1 shikimate dehydrogenase [Cyanobacteria bacterium UBA11149]HCA94802.1 shikimate dehydrogenase [Cyanobacteria bacterium UBA9226]
MPKITGKTKLLGVIGDPIEHSLSPVMHNAAIAKLNLDYIYLPFPIKAQDLQNAIAGFAAIGLQGFSITIPHKQAIIPFLSEISDIAQSVGAVNTVWRTETGWSGTNTDVAGFIAPLKAYNWDWSQTTAVILGNGGASRAVVVGCYQLGCKSIHIVGRSWEKLQQFQESWLNSPLPITTNIHPDSELPELISQADLLVNTTPVGMYPHIAESPVNLDIMTRLKETAIVYDLIYTPKPTQFLKYATKQGATGIDGLEMLVQQGAAALEIWLQQTPPADIMRQSLQEYLKGES